MSAITGRDFANAASPAPFAVTASAPAPQAANTDRFDIVVAGAGHNSLAATAYLAKAGYRCLVLEGRPIVGGGAKTAELTLRGFKHDTCSSTHIFIQDNPMLRNDELKLGDYGLEYIYPDPIYHTAFPDGGYITQWRDLDRTCAEFAKYSKKDALAFRRMCAEYQEVESLFNAVSFAPVGFGKSLNERLAEHPHGKFWQRRIAMSYWEILRDNFEDDHCRGFMLLSPWGHQAPQNPMTGRAAYQVVSQQRTGRPIPKGGSGQLTQALARFIEAHGGVILTNKSVQRLIVENGKCAGVECTDGSSYRAGKAVLSTIHIKQLVDMAPRELWGSDFIDGVDTWQGETTECNASYATTEPLRFPVEGGTLTPVHSSVLANSARALRFAYDYSRSAVNMEEPPLSLICASVADPTRAPAGMHTIKVIGYQPYDLKEGPATLGRDQGAGGRRESEIPAAIHAQSDRRQDPRAGCRKSTRYRAMNPHNWHGSCHAGSSDPAQSGAMRPMPGWAQYRMPIPGLYQTGATTYPGGSITGAPGRNAATVMLKDFGTSIEQVLQKKT